MNSVFAASNGPTGSLCLSSGVDAESLVFASGLTALDALADHATDVVRLTPVDGVHVTLECGVSFRATPQQAVWARPSSTEPASWIPSAKLHLGGVVALALGAGDFGPDPLSEDDARALGILVGGGYISAVTGQLRVLVLRTDVSEVQTELGAFLERQGLLIPSAPQPRSLPIERLSEGGILDLPLSARDALETRFGLDAKADGFSMGLPPRIRNVPHPTLRAFLDGVFVSEAVAAQTRTWSARAAIGALLAGAGFSPALIDHPERYAEPVAGGRAIQWSRVVRLERHLVRPVAVRALGPFVAQSVVFRGAEEVWA